MKISLTKKAAVDCNLFLEKKSAPLTQLLFNRNNIKQNLLSKVVQSVHKRGIL